MYGYNFLKSPNSVRMHYCEMRYRNSDRMPYCEMRYRCTIEKYTWNTSFAQKQMSVQYIIHVGGNYKTFTAHLLVIAYQYERIYFMNLEAVPQSSQKLRAQRIRMNFISISTLGFWNQHLNPLRSCVLKGIE